MVALSSVAAVGYALLASLPIDYLGAKYACICIVVSAIYSTYPINHAWNANNLGNETKRAVGMGLFTAIGNLGSIIGTRLYISTQAPQFRPSNWVCFALSLGSALCSLWYHLVLKRINRRRDELYGRPDPLRPVNVAELADDAPMYRYFT